MDEPKPVQCNRACFDGYKGMDFCGGCRGTGSQLLAAGRRFPNTQRGYLDAVEAINNQEPSE